MLVLHHPELVASPDEQEEDVKEEEEDAEDVENPEEDSSWVLEVRVFSHAASSNIATSDIAIGGNCYYQITISAIDVL